MLKCEMMNDTTRYFPMERVLGIMEHPEGGLTVQFLNPKGENAGARCKRFQIIKSGTWYS